MSVTLMATAQSGINSPYSQYGLGVLAEQMSGFNRGMNGVGIGFREHNQVNYLNPAAYSAMDSLMFLFDVGVSGQITNFKEEGKKKNAKNANFDYAVAGFRMARHLGVSFGIVPFSGVGYNYSGSDVLDANGSVYYNNTYNGKGGVREVFVGAGWEPVKNLSVGFNAAYMWGDYTRSITNRYTEGSSTSAINTLSKVYSATIRSYKLDFGAQFTLPLGKKDLLTVGATYSPGHKVSDDAECTVTSVNPTTSVSNNTTLTAEGGIKIPDMFAVGMGWNHDQKLRVGIDYSMQKWGSVGFPDNVAGQGSSSYAVRSNYFTDRHKLTLGGEFCKGEYARGFFSRLRYRAGVSYTSPYVKIKGADGPRDLSVSAGFGIPIMNAWNSRSLLNISAQWVNTSGKGLLTENTFRINIGITFNERWFMKWMVK